MIRLPAGIVSSDGRICNLDDGPLVLSPTTQPDHPLTLPDFETTVTQHQHRVLGYAARLLGDAEQAADVVQDAMLKLWRHRDTVDSEGAVSWLLRVTHNACIDALRRRKLERGIFNAEADAELISGDGIGPDRAAESADLRGHLERALQRLAEPYRSIVILREVEDFRYDEICGALDLPMTTVKVYLHRGRHMLRKIIEEAFQHELI